MTTVLKFGGELLEDAAGVRNAAAAVLHLSRTDRVVVVHGGGRTIDAELRARGIAPAFADGIRITDGPTLDTVVGVLAGRTNTRLVSAIGAAGARAVGLTGADAGIGLSVVAPPRRTTEGAVLDLGLVGEPADAHPGLLLDLLGLGYVPVVASIGVTRDGTLLNVNADTFAAHLAVALRAERMMIAGSTPGVLDRDGATIPCVNVAEIDGLAASGAAHSGMIAKLQSCRHAVEQGVAVSVVGGRNATDLTGAPGTIISNGMVAA